MKLSRRSVETTFVRTFQQYMRITALMMTAALSTMLGAQTEAAKHPTWGTGSSNDAASYDLETTVAAPVSAHGSFTAAQYSSGGVSLRNRGAGVINISDVVTPVKTAVVYWSVITSG